MLVHTQLNLPAVLCFHFPFCVHKCLHSSLALSLTVCPFFFLHFSVPFPSSFFFFASASVSSRFFHHFSRYYFISVFLCLLLFILFLSILLSIILSLCSVFFVPRDVLIFAFIIYLFNVFVYIFPLHFFLFFISLRIPFCFSFSFISVVLSPTGNCDWEDQ